MLTASDVAVQNRFEIPDVARSSYATIVNRKQSKIAVLYVASVKSTGRRSAGTNHLSFDINISLPSNDGADAKALELIRIALRSNMQYMTGLRAGNKFEISAYKYFNDSRIGRIMENWPLGLDL
jgi:hypothetical protein